MTTSLGVRRGIGLTRGTAGAKARAVGGGAWTVGATDRAARDAGGGEASGAPGGAASGPATMISITARTMYAKADRRFIRCSIETAIDLRLAAWHLQKRARDHSLPGLPAGLK